MMFTHRRRAASVRWLRAAVIAVAVLLTAPAASFAGVDYLFNGSIVSGSPAVGPRHSLVQTYSYRSSASGGNVCNNAYNEDGSFAHTVDKCTTIEFSHAEHPYCGCVLR